MRLTSFIAVSAVVLMAVIGTTYAAVRSGQPRRALAVWAAWLIPGLGHLVLGQIRKGLYFAGVTAFLLVTGLWICGWRTVSFDDNPFYYVGQFGSGVTWLLGSLLGTEKSFPRSDLPAAWYDPGLLYVCVAGLLNLVMVLSALVGAAGGAAIPAAAPPPAPVLPLLKEGPP